MLHNGRLSEIISLNRKDCKARNQKCLFDKLHGETVYREYWMVEQMLQALMLITSKWAKTPCAIWMQTVGSPFYTLTQIEQNKQQKKKSSDENCSIEIMMSSLNTKNSTLHTEFRNILFQIISRNATWHFNITIFKHHYVQS